VHIQVSSRREQLAEFYRKFGPLLISRLKEREENVKSDIFQAYMALLRQTKLLIPSSAFPHHLVCRVVPVS
jgi:cullin-associated NEDD8-dissociated protein 1